MIVVDFGHVGPDHVLEADARSASVRSMREPDRQARADADFAFVGLRHELGRNRRQDRGTRATVSAVAARSTVGRCCSATVDRAAIEVVEPSKHALAHREQRGRARPPLATRRRQLQQPRAEHRHDRHGDEQRHRQREHDDDRELNEQDARDAGQEEQRHEHRDVRQRRRQNRGPDFLAAFDRGLQPRLAHAPCAGTCSRARRSRRRRSCRCRAPARRTSSCSA